VSEVGGGVLGLARALASGAGPARETTDSALARADQAQVTLNAWITIAAERARGQADAAAAALASGSAGPLAGVPYALKDNFLSAGLRTTCGSRILGGFVPPFDATVNRRLAEAGAVLLGKANMDEFAMGSSSENPHFGPVRNPWDPGRVPGGSSGGSAALVAAGVVPFAIGSDTGGSVRQPAAFCGVTGLKPSYGRCSRYGLVAYASSLDQPGVLARSAADCARVLSVIAGFDPSDATSSDVPVPDYEAALGDSVRGVRVGVVAEFFGPGVEPAVAARCQEALALLEQAGARLVPVSLPTLALAIPAYYVIAPAEASSNLARFDGVRYGLRAEGAGSLEDLVSRTRAEGFGAEVKRRILAGTYVLSAGYYDAYYRRAQRVRRRIADEFARAFESCDLLAGPTAPGVAFRIGEKSGDPLAMYAQDINTVAVNLAGLPAISLPAGFSGGLPVGLQLIAAAFREPRLLAAGATLQARSDWHLQQPPGYVL